MVKVSRRRRLWDAYAFPGFRPEPTVRGVFGDPQVRIVALRRRSKKRLAVTVVEGNAAGTTVGLGACGISPVVRFGSTFSSIFAAFIVVAAAL
jgi:hypothetical protein